MKFLVLGAGRMGYAVVYDLMRSARVDEVVVADSDVAKLTQLKSKFAHDKVIPAELNIALGDELIDLMSRCDIVISCLNSGDNYDLAKAALAAKTNFCDFGSPESVVERQFLLLDEIAREEEVVIIPNLGLAPGLVSLLAVAAASSLDELYEIRIRVGDVPIEPQDPFNYTITSSVEGLLQRYAEKATIIRDGQVFQVPSLTELEDIEFPKPFGVMEAFSTAGGIATLPKTYSGSVRHLDFKTIRYAGHCQKMQAIKHLGLMDNEPVSYAGGKIIPRALLASLLSDKLPQDQADAVLLRITVTGTKKDKPTQIIWECIDYGLESEGLSAIMRMTAFPASIVAQMVARGDISEHGVLSQEKVVPIKLFLAELAGRGITLTMTEREPVLPEKR